MNNALKIENKHNYCKYCLNPVIKLDPYHIECHTQVIQYDKKIIEVTELEKKIVKIIFELSQNEKGKILNFELLKLILEYEYISDKLLLNSLRNLVLGEYIDLNGFDGDFFSLQKGDELYITYYSSN